MQPEVKTVRMLYPVKPHLPLITSRVEFRLNHFQLPPAITLRQDLGKRLREHRQTRPLNIPYDRTHRPRIHTHGSPNPDTDTDNQSELSELPSAYDDEQPKVKIPKPPGEAGRRNCGGFNLEKALGWEEAKYNELVVSARILL